jgi:integrase
MAKVRKRGDSWQIDYFDPNGKRVRQSFKKKKDAEAELGKRVSLIAEKRYLDVKKDYNTTLGELLDKYTENYRNQVWFKTSKSYFLENFRQFFGKDTRLANIRYVDLETYQNHLKQKPTKQGKIRTDATVNREMTCLHHVFTKAVEWEMTERSPFDQGKTLLLKENNKRLRYLSKQEIDKLLAESPKHLKRIVKCAIHTGMRRGEILGLKWSQIRNGFIYLEKTKTNEARQIPINDDLAGLLRKIRREQGLTSEHVFTYRQGEHALKHGKWAMQAKTVRCSIASARRAFEGAVKRAGIRDFKFHDLRHTFASQMIMRGANLKEVQEILGHKGMTMTLRYAHLSQEHKKKAVSLLNGLTTPGDSDSEEAGVTCHKSVTFSERAL